MTNTARTAQTLLIAASGMLFAAFTSAMVVRRGLGGDWAAPALPPWIWATLAFGPVASWLVYTGRVRAAMAVGSVLTASQVALVSTLNLGVINEAFLAVLTTAHALHAAAGVAALGRFGVHASLFWHFVGALWIYVLFLFGVWA